MPFANPKEVAEYVRELEETSRPVRTSLASKVGVDMCYYEGSQWISGGNPTVGPWARLDRLLTNWNPDSSRLRATVNRVSRYVIKSAAATFPQNLYPTVYPPAFDNAAESAFVSQTIEDALSAQVDDSGLLAVCRAANFRRCVAGTYGIGLTLDADEDGYRCLKAFAFPPTRLILDPAVDKRDLRDHDCVIYCDAWTKSKIQRVFGKLIPPAMLEDRNLQTIGNLMTQEIELNNLSGNRVFSYYRTHSKSRGAMVYQIHEKDSSGRHSGMYVAIKTAGSADLFVLNMEKPFSPFGGCGLPLALLHGHPRSDSMWSISDVSMLKDDQDRLNLFATMLMRQSQKHAGYQWVVDKRSMPRGTSDEEFGQRFSNAVAGLITVDMGRRDQNIAPPQLVQHPAPQPFMQDLMRMFQSEMREQSFRSEGSFGVTKSHVPDSSFRSALEQADQVSGVRITEDIAAYEHILSVLCGTMIGNVQAESRSTLAMLARAGISAEQFGALASIDPTQVPGTIKIPESSVRYRSHQARRDDLLQAVQLGAIPPDVYLRTMASDLDSPVTDMDKLMSQEAQKAAYLVLLGQPWTPLPLGQYSPYFIDAFRRAILDKRAKADPAAMQRVVQAILLQQQAVAMEQAAVMPQEEQQAGEPAPAPEDQGPRTIQDALNQIS